MIQWLKLERTGINFTSWSNAEGNETFLYSQMPDPLKKYVHLLWK